MRIRLLSPGGKMPGWISEGFETYRKRLRSPLQLELVELPLANRKGGRNSEECKAEEGRRMLQLAGDRDHLVVLDERGASWTTRKLASRVEHWLMDGRDIALLMGGPDGLSAECLQAASEKWSLSALTLPHGLVRIVVAEQLYRAQSILHHHPYHRD